MAIEPEVLCVIPARHTSKRFPGKCLAKINGKPMIQHVIERCAQSLFVDKIVVAVPSGQKQRPLVNWLKKHKAEYYIGKGIPENDVLKRLNQVADAYLPRFIVRVNGDSPIIIPDLIDRAVKELKERRYEGCQYVGYAFKDTPSVLTRYAAPEVFTSSQLRIWNSINEHVTVAAYQDGYPHWIRMTGAPFPTVVDTREDIKVIENRIKKWK